MKLVLLAVAAVALLLVWVRVRTGKMNRDPAQQAIADLIVELEAKGAPPGERFLRECMAIAQGAPGSVSTRLAHALSLARPRISSKTYEDVRQLFRYAVSH